jgi:hypothetical protein
MVGFGHRARSRVKPPFSYMILLIVFGNESELREHQDLNLISLSLVGLEKGMECLDYNLPLGR